MVLPRVQGGTRAKASLAALVATPPHPGVGRIKGSAAESLTCLGGAGSRPVSKYPGWTLGADAYNTLVPYSRCCFLSLPPPPVVQIGMWLQEHQSLRVA